MMRILRRIKLWQKILVISCTFTLPLGVLGFFVLQGYNDDINFADLEKLGNQYQRPLEDLLEQIPEHQFLVQRCLAGEKQLQNEVAARQAQIDKAFDTLEAVDAKIGSALQFTDDGLAKRKREHVRVRTVRVEWQNLKTQWANLSSQTCQEQHAHVVADIRTMIAHAGDQSNLILDPDLDSYYLMDVTLLALPQTHDRLAVIRAFGEDLLRRQDKSKADLTQLAVHGALLKDADFDRVSASTQTALNEDDNFYGRSERLHRNIAPVLSEYTAATQGFLELIRRVVNSEKNEVGVAEFNASGTKARQASFRLWHSAVDELDVLLQKRIDHFKDGRARSFAMTLAAVLVSVVLAFLTTRCITKPIGSLTAATSAAALSGDLTQQVEVKSADEVGQLGHAFNKLIGSLNGMVGQIQRSGIQVNTAATEIAATSKQQQATASEIASTTVEIGATSREISATAQELLKTITEVTTVAEHAAELAGSGQSGLTRMETTMHHIMDASSTIASKLSVLNEKAVNINAVVTTINKVADQTNLLSLNAAIEAEKAGEYGLGFAVVATEIRRLADQTAVATCDIEQMVKEMHSAVSAGVMGMDKFSEEVRKGVEDVRQIGAQLAQIIQQVQALTPRFEAVNDGMRSQAMGAQQISEALAQLSDSAHQTAESLQESNQVIERLNEAARGLQDGVARFKMAA